MMSHLLEGNVRHRRARPFVYELDHDVFYFALDLAELDQVIDRLRLVSRRRTNLLEFRDDDHLDPPARDIAAAVDAHLRDEGMDPAGWQVTLVTNLRMFGYVFNPASFYLCRDRSGDLAAVIVEVHNTHHERHLYTLRRQGEGQTGDRPFVASMDKEFYVSPFIDMVGRYSVRVRDEPSRLRITINEDEDGQRLLHTSLDLVRRPLTDRTVARMLMRHPFNTHRTIGLIHWHALRLWRRGARFRRHRDGAGQHGDPFRAPGELVP
jgi:DUF1365 family protein